MGPSASAGPTGIARNGESNGDVQAALLPNAPEAPAAASASSTSLAWDMHCGFPSVLGVILVALLACYVAFTKYSIEIDIETYYMHYLHVAVMVFVGFGFLMTFLKRHSLGAVSLNMAASCMMMLVAILLHGLFDVNFHCASLKCVSVSMESLIEGLFCAAAGMISFGALLGKVSPTQLVLLLLLEVPLYSFNAEYLVNGVFGGKGAQDFGGSMAIHAFGAYFGLSATWVLFRRAKGVGADHSKNASSYFSDVTAMIGTTFLWVYWPSFNAAIATVGAGDSVAATTSALRFFVVINTVLSLAGATLAAFAACSALKGKLDMVLVQNATLAGGVAVGSAATMVVGGAVVNVTPGGALGVGAAAGLLSSWGFSYVTPCLESTIGLKDTCGVHNLHGMPGVLGGLVPALTLAVAGEHGASIAQLMALGGTVGLALAGGAGSALLVGLVGNEQGGGLARVAYEDAAAFVEVEDE